MKANFTSREASSLYYASKILIILSNDLAIISFIPIEINEFFDLFWMKAFMFYCLVMDS